MKEQGVVEPADTAKTAKTDAKPTGIVPRLRVTWRKGWRAAAAAWQEYPSSGLALDPDATQPLIPQLEALRRRAVPVRQRLTSRTVRRRLLAAVAVCAVVFVSCGALNFGRVMDALAAARDARAQVAVIQATMRGGGATDPARLAVVQAHLRVLSADLQRVQADVPLGSVWASAPGSSGMIHLLRMASDLVRAGEVAMPAVIILAPHVKQLTSSLQGAGGAAPPPSGAQVPPLTTDSAQQAAADLERAIPFLQAAWAERAYVSDLDLRLIGLGKYLPYVHLLDRLAPILPKVFPALPGVAAALPTLLGVGQPTSFVLFSLDSDELRPTGGFMGNYAVLTLSDAVLTSGVQLHDIYSLDCPLGLFQCPEHPIPDQFAWMQVNATHFGLRDTNLDPDYPASARLAEQWLVRDGEPPVQGVFSLTPRVIEQILAVTGPVTVVPYCTVVTADNLRGVIHYYHLSTPLGISSWCPGTQVTSTNRKAFDAELGSQLLHRIAGLPQAQQSALIHDLLRDFQTRDIQLYFNNPSLEAVVSAFGVDGTVQSPRGDSLYVVDTNTGGNYANADVEERVADTIHLDARGTATHDLTLTYTYPKVSHLYNDVYEIQGGYWTYRDFVRVMVPSRSQFIGQDGCAPYPSDEANHAVWGCSILFGQPNTVTLHFRWTVPHAAALVNGSLQYTLLIQHEPGTRNPTSVTIVPPAGDHVTAATPPLHAAGTSQVAFADTLTTDQRLSVQFGA